MIRSADVEKLTTMDRYDLKMALAQSGYTGMSFESAVFEGITQDRDFCYSVTFFDDSGTGRVETGKVFVRYDDATGDITADF